MRLTSRLLLGSLGVVGVLIVVVVAIIETQLRRQIIERTTSELVSEARFVAVEWTPRVNADSLADAAGTALGHRVTLIRPDGRVIGDSYFDHPEIDHLQNHATRPEVMEANRTGFGTSSRQSPSEGDQELYVAVRAPLGVARVSVSTHGLQKIFANASRAVLSAGLIALAIATVLAWLFARSVSGPVEELSGVARALAAGDLSRRPALTAPGEIGELATALHRMAEELDARLAALQSERALLTETAAALGEGIVVIDVQHRVTRMNDTARRLLAVDTPIPFDVDRLPRDRALRDALAAAARGESAAPFELTIDGRVLTLTARALSRGGAVLALLDLTTMRRLEVVRRDFVANVSHELKTPLTIVRGFAETLADEETSPEDRRRFAEIIRANAQRMQRLVDDLLDLSRIESGGWRPNPLMVNVDAVAREAFASVAPDAAAKGLGLEVHADDAPEVWADATAVRQIVANLVENAVRHTATGSVRVRTERSATEGGTWLIVQDTGTGIPPEHLPRIFERFYRVDPGRSREAGGTGLGLAIVRHLVEAHGGRVVAESAPGKGTTVGALFPDAPAV